MPVINHSNYDKQLFAICEDNASQFELISLFIDWAMLRFLTTTPDSDILSQMEVALDTYILRIEKSFVFDKELKVLFRFHPNKNELTILSVMDIT